MIALILGLALALPLAAGGEAALSADAIQRFPAPEARQGVAVDDAYVYAVSDSLIAKYDKHTGAKLAEWRGDSALHPHINSCEVLGAELICAASNYPRVPMESRIEVFDPMTMTLKRTLPLGRQGGSLTWVDRHDGRWWAGFANYDGYGGEPGRDHRFAKVMTFDDAWRPLNTWTFPDAVLDRFGHYATSGGGWGPDGRLYITGHDRGEIYVMSVPAGGGVLRLEAMIAAPIEGQAIAFDKSAKDVLYGISRRKSEVVALRLPARAKLGSVK